MINCTLISWNQQDNTKLFCYVSKRPWYIYMQNLDYQHRSFVITSEVITHFVFFCYEKGDSRPGRMFSFSFRSDLFKLLSWYHTAQKMKFSIKDFFSKCDQIRSFLQIWLHLPKKSLMKNFIFRAVSIWLEIRIQKQPFVVVLQIRWS